MVKSTKRTMPKKGVRSKKQKRVYKSINKKKTKKSKQRGGNPVMIKNLCSSSKRGGSIRQHDSVSAAYIEELCNSSEQDQNKSQQSNSVTTSNTNVSQEGGGLFSGIMSKVFKAATFPVSIATGTFKKISGVDLGDVVRNNVSKVLNSAEVSGSGSDVKEKVKEGVTDRDTDSQLSSFLSKRNM